MTSESAMQQQEFALILQNKMELLVLMIIYVPCLTIAMASVVAMVSTSLAKQPLVRVQVTEAYTTTNYS